jgi:hypothetical protein
MLSGFMASIVSARKRGNPKRISAKAVMMVRV